VAKHTSVPASREVREDTWAPDTRPGAGTQTVASESKQEERVCKLSVVATHPPHYAIRRLALRTQDVCSRVPLPGVSRDQSRPVPRGAQNVSLERVLPLLAHHRSQTPWAPTRPDCPVPSRGPRPQLLLRARADALAAAAPLVAVVSSDRSKYPGMRTISSKWSGIPNRSSVGIRTDILAVVDLRGAIPDGHVPGVEERLTRAGIAVR
jgi:hypothetical protein